MATWKSFEKTPSSAKNYLVVVTPALHARLNDFPNLDRCFLLSDLRGSPEMRDEFMDEIFNHGLRITKFMASAPNPRN